MFVNHHTIDFYEGGKINNQLKVCYKCGEVQWNGSISGASDLMMKVITPLIIKNGMKPRKDWNTMAQKRYKGSQSSKLAIGDKDITSNIIMFPTAKWVVGRKGRSVKNPYTGAIVDVEGIAAGKKVRDPNDSNPKNIFIVPEL